MSKLTLAMIVAFHLLSAGAVSAQPFGTARSNVISAENLMGLWRADVNPENGSDTDVTYVSLFGNPAHQTPFDIPKLAFDRFVADSFSVGGFFSYATMTAKSGNAEGDTNLLLIGPRLGYGKQLSDLAGLWMRAGITYYTGDEDPGGAAVTYSGVGLNLEVLFALFAAPSFMFTVGPVIALPLSGNVEFMGQETGYKFRSFGVAVGLAGVI